MFVWLPVQHTCPLPAQPRKTTPLLLEAHRASCAKCRVGTLDAIRGSMQWAFNGWSFVTVTSAQPALNASIGPLTYRDQKMIRYVCKYS